MAYSDNPTSDKYSKNSEKSLFALKGILLMENGFISRTVSPDFGVDENVELLYHDGKNFTGASGKHFAIQLKSVETKNPYINKKGKDCIKIQFETSRLGYLLRNELPLGIVIVYDIKTSILYYEYAEEIYNQLTDINDGKLWKSKGKVMIYLNKDNILNAESAKKIHNKMLHMHQNAQMCLKAFGENYGIRTYDDELVKDKVDLNNPKVAIEHLESIGWKLIHENDFSMLLFLLNNVHQNDIFKSSKLTAIVATIYCESGQFIESHFFTSKYNQLFNDTDEYFDALKFIKYKTDFALGNIDYDGFQSTLEGIVQSIEGEYNQIVIRINLLHIKLLKETSNKKHNEETINDILSIIQALSKSKLSEKSKYHLASHNTFNIIIYYINYITSAIGTIKIKESTHTPIFNSEIIVFKRKEKLFEALVSSTLADIWNHAEKNNDRYLKASCLQNTSNYFFLKNLNALMMNVPELLTVESSKEQFETKINQAISSAKLFEDLGRFKDSYTSLSIGYEITAFYFFTQNTVINNQLSDLDNLLLKFTKRYGLPKYESEVTKYFNMKKDGSTYSEELVEEYADLILTSLKIPIDRKPNIILKIKDVHLFNLTEKSINFNLREDLRHTYSPYTHFKEPVIFMCDCKNCKHQSFPSHDINLIIKYITEHTC
jgi:hypothetical protein